MVEEENNYASMRDVLRFLPGVQLRVNSGFNSSFKISLLSFANDKLSKGITRREEWQSGLFVYVFSQIFSAELVMRVRRVNCYELFVCSK